MTAAELGGSIQKGIAQVGTCWQLDLAQTVGAGRHRTSGVLCATCPHGIAWTIKKAEGDRRWDVVVDKEEELRKRGLDRRRVLPCGMLQQFSDEATTPWVAIAGTAVSPTQVASLEGQPRQLVIDEAESLVDTLAISADTVSSWENKLGGRFAWLSKRVAEAEAHGWLSADEWQSALDEWNNLIDAVSPLLDDLRRFLAGLDGEVTRERAIAYSLALRDAAQTWSHAQETATAQWERVEVSWQGVEIERFDAPLRAAISLGEAAEVGTLDIERRELGETIRHSIVVRVLNALGETLRAHVMKEHPALILDATPSPGVLAAVRNLGGEIVNVEATQPLRVLVDMSSIVGRGRKEQQMQRVEVGVEMIREARAQLATAVGAEEEQIAVLSHKPWTIAFAESENLIRPMDPREKGRDADPADRVDEMLGWWGRDERAHNRWANAAGLVAIGSPTAPPWALRDEYASDRALALLTGSPAAEWPEWAENEPLEMRPIVKVGDREVVWPAQLPVNPHIREWVLSRLAIGWAQLLGRLRAVRRDDAPPVLALGAVPDLQQFGIEVHVADSDDPLPLAPTATDRASVARAEAELRVLDAMRAVGAGASARAIRGWWEAQGLPRPSFPVIARTKAALAVAAGDNPVTRRTVERERAARIAIIVEARVAGVRKRSRRDHVSATADAIERGVVMRRSAAPVTMRPTRRKGERAASQCRGGPARGPAPPAARVG